VICALDHRVPISAKSTDLHFPARIAGAGKGLHVDDCTDPDVEPLKLIELRGGLELLHHPSGSLAWCLHAGCV
jgi:hypothetical protein